MKWGQRPPVLEETAFLELLDEAVRKGMFSREFLTELDREFSLALG